FIRGGRELRVLDVESGGERVVATGLFGLPPILVSRPIGWWPDGQWLAYLTAGERMFTNGYVGPAASGEARPVSWLPNVFGGSLVWTPDGEQLLFTTRQRTEQASVARVSLVPRTPRFREDRFRDLFQQETPRATSPASERDARAASQGREARTASS